MQWIPYYWALLALISLTSTVKAIEPNFEDIEESKSEPQNEVINIEQDSPHSNAIHIAHNIPTGSDITVTQKNPYNSTVHIALNIGKDCKVKVFSPDMCRFKDGKVKVFSPDLCIARMARSSHLICASSRMVRSRL